MARTKNTAWRAEELGKYWYVKIGSAAMINPGEWYKTLRIDYRSDVGSQVDNSHYVSGNYFRTRKQAEAMIVKIRKTIKNG
jgi:hypothetical protein